MSQQLADSCFYIFRDLSQKKWGNVSALMHWSGCKSTVFVIELLVRTTLPNLNKTHSLKNSYNLSRFKHRNITH